MARNLLLPLALILGSTATAEENPSRLEVEPGFRVLHAPGRWHQLGVRAHFANGEVRDVTRLTVFASSEEAIATVDGAGLVEFHRPGEVAILCRYLDTIRSVPLAYLQPRPGFVWRAPPENNFIDRHVHAKLKQLSLAPSSLCDDGVFLRRVYLDLLARLPTLEETRSFLEDRSDDKRDRLVARLLERPEYADFWTLKWMDVLRATRTTLGLKGVTAYNHWLREHLKRNTPFDRVVRELLTAGGNTHEVGPANFYRAVEGTEELAETTAQVFLGIRIGCAKCHNHPFESWTQDDYFHFAAFFARVGKKGVGGRNLPANKPEVPAFVYAEERGEIRHLRTGQNVAPRFLTGKTPDIGKQEDRRVALADWLTDGDNPFFARAVVNRVWFHLFGKGIVDPPDDFRDSNPPANEPLLAALSRDFVAHGYDLKHLLRTILASRTYQLEAASGPWNQDDQRYFSRTYPRLLSAEQLLDAIVDLTEVPEKFEGFPRGTRAVQLPDGLPRHPFLQVFGRPARTLACECERSGDANLAMAMELVNGPFLQDRLKVPDNRLGRLLKTRKSDREIAEDLYRAALCRGPDERELASIRKHLEGSVERRLGWEDVLWALVNHREFLYRR